MYMTKKIAHKVSENKYINGLIQVHVITTGNERGACTMFGTESLQK